MISWLENNQEFKFLEFLARNRERIRLLIPEKEKERLIQSVEKLECPILTFRTIQKRPTSIDDGLVNIVLDERGETKRVSALNKSHPGIQFLGAAQSVIPALLAENADALFNQRPPPLPKKLVAVIATPRSGSSYVCDVLTDLRIARPKEHLRPPVINLLASNYEVDHKVFFLNFLRFANKNDWAATKVIIHFLEEYLISNSVAPLIGIARLQSISFYPIFLDRNDLVRQTVSGQLAAQRGVWHITGASSRRAVDANKDIPYFYSGLLKRYLLYQRQSAFLEKLEELFPRRLSIRYEKDVNDRELLLDKLTEYLNISERPVSFRVSEKREKMSDNLNETQRKLFLDEFEKMFGIPPITE